MAKKKLPEWQRASLELISIPFIILKFIGVISEKILQYIKNIEGE